jgi:glycosyltransferase involved in cell wall biosynthesis
MGFERKEPYSSGEKSTGLFFEKGGGILLKKKILFVHHSANIGGAGISGLNVLNSIDRELYDIVVYCNTASKNNHMTEIFHSGGYKVIPGGSSPVIFSHCVGSEHFILSPRFILNIIRIFKDRHRIDCLIKNVAPDIVIINSMTLFWIGKTAKKHGKKTVCFFRETYVKGLLGIRTAIVKRWLGRYIDSIAFISSHELMQSKCVKTRKTVIYNTFHEKSYSGYDRAECMRELNLPHDPFKLLYVGGMSPLKGAYVIIKAMSLLKNENIKLVFVGFRQCDGKKRFSDCRTPKEKIKYLLNMDYGKKCMDYIDKHNLGKSIVFYDYQMNMGLFYASCDALVVPITKPHQARPLFEAGCVKIPVVITNFPNIREFADDDSCYLFKSRDYRGLAKAILEVKRHPETAAKKVQINYINTTSRHNEQNYAREIKNLLAGLEG